MIGNDYIDTREFAEWLHDDITWCMDEECPNIECRRNLKNRSRKGGMISCAMFRGTEECPMYTEEDKP